MGLAPTAPRVSPCPGPPDRVCTALQGPPAYTFNLNLRGLELRRGWRPTKLTESNHPAWRHPQHRHSTPGISPAHFRSLSLKFLKIIFLSALPCLEDEARHRPPGATRHHRASSPARWLPISLLCFALLCFALLCFAAKHCLLGIVSQRMTSRCPRHVAIFLRPRPPLSPRRFRPRHHAAHTAHCPG